MSDIQRYIHYDKAHEWSNGFPSDIGEWVKYDDHIKALAEAQEKIIPAKTTSTPRPKEKKGPNARPKSRSNGRTAKSRPNASPNARPNARPKSTLRSGKKNKS